MPAEITVGLAGAAVHVAADDPGAARLLDFLFSDFPDSGAADASLALQLASDPSSGFTLLRDGAPVFASKPAATAALLTLAEVIGSLVANGREALILHAAAVAGEGFCALLPGASGAGKSTLSAWLDARGYRCLSDEMACLAADGTLHPFPRPICLETNAPQHLGAELETARREERLISSAEAILLKPRSPMPAVVPKLSAVVFPAYRPGTGVTTRRIPKSRAVVRLLGSLANAEHFDDRGFAAFGTVVRDIEIMELGYGDLKHNEAAILDFFGTLAGVQPAYVSPA